MHAFVASVSVIIVSEIGDKTFLHSSNNGHEILETCGFCWRNFSSWFDDIPLCTPWICINDNSCWVTQYKVHYKLRYLD